MKRRRNKHIQNDLFRIYVSAFAEQLDAIKNSARWKVGHRVIRFIELLLGRKPRTLGIDHLQNMTKQYLTEAEYFVESKSAAIGPNILRRHFSHEISTCGFLVSNNDWKTAAQGDVFTALELAAACEKEYGWSCKLIDKQTQLNEPVDLIISLLFEFDVRTLKSSAIKIGWVRSYAEYWIMKPWFESFDIILCSSKKIKDFISEVTKKEAYVFPIATNPTRFAKGVMNPSYKSELCFTGNRWHAEREIEKQLIPYTLPYKFKVFGRGWSTKGAFSSYHEGQLSYENMPDVYASSELILDDSNESTSKWESVNSRIFDVLGMGKKILTNNTQAVEALFENEFPTYGSSEELIDQIDHILGSPKNYTATFELLQQEVLAKHTYTHRAAELNSILELHHGVSNSIAIKISATTDDDLTSWGDYHFAKSLAEAFRESNCDVRIDLKSHWYDEQNSMQINLIIAGLYQYEPEPDKINILWIISHPEQIRTEHLEGFDHIFVASESFAQVLDSKIQNSVSVLHQCTDVNIFYPDSNDNLTPYERLYVANSRHTDRLGIQYSTESQIPLDIIGANWDQIVPSNWVKANHVPNHLLRYYYSTASIIINDHWPSMREHGFYSNRLYDVLACGGQLVSDEVQGLKSFFKGHIHVYEDINSFQNLVRNVKNRKTNEEAIHFIRANHTFNHRVAAILDKIVEIKNEK